MQERTALEDQLSAIGRIEQELDDQLTMIELGEAEKDQKAITDAEEEGRVPQGYPPDAANLQGGPPDAGNIMRPGTGRIY